MKKILKASVLKDVCYDIRGPVLREAVRLEEEGYGPILAEAGLEGEVGDEAPGTEAEAAPAGGR